MKYYTRVIWTMLLMAIGANGLVEAQVGKEFWFAAPDVTVSHSGDGPYAFRVTAGATVRLAGQQIVFYIPHIRLMCPLILK